MAYININEVDRTAVYTTPTTNANVVFVPLNASDGPSDKPVLCTSYEDFVQIFGQDPNPNTTMMTSWEFAANLLKHKMPVLARRITHYLDSEGRNTTKREGVKESGMLDGVATATGIVKGPKVEGFQIQPSEEVMDREYPIVDSGSEHLETNNYTATFQFTAQEADATTDNPTPQPLAYVAKFGTAQTTLSDTANVVYHKHITAFKKMQIRVTNESVYTGVAPALDLYLDRIEVSGLGDTTSVGYSNIGTMTTAAVLRNSGTPITSEEGVVDVNKKYIRICSGQSLFVEVDVPEDLDEASIAVKLIPSTASVAEGIDNIRGKSFSVALSSLDMENFKWTTFVTTKNETAEDQRCMVDTVVNLPAEDLNESITSMKELDAAGNLNLFAIEYKHPGVNGNRISVGLHFVEFDGFYIEVYNNEQRLEQVKLIDLKYASQDNLWGSYNVTQHAEIIWAKLLANFEIFWDDHRNDERIVTIQDIGRKSLATNYINVSLNPALHVGNYLQIVQALALCKRTTRAQLSGGSGASDDCVVLEVPKCYHRICDKYLYDVKFISNGGFVDVLTTPSEVVTSAPPKLVRRNIETAQLHCAETRGDALAFIDMPFKIEREQALEYFSYLNTSYGTTYAPWVKKKLDTGYIKWCPPSYIALESIAKSVVLGNEVYAPPAGVNRAIITGVHQLSFEIPADYIEYWADNYTQFINPIVYIDGYGYAIFGQKTLLNRVGEGDIVPGSALQYLNARLVANEIKKRIFKCCIELTFEHNNLHTWLEFNTKMTKLLDKLKSNDSITHYEVIMDKSTMTDYDIQTNHIVGTVRVAIGTTAEKFDIAFEMVPNSVRYLNIDYSQDNLTR